MNWRNALSVSFREFENSVLDALKQNELEYKRKIEPLAAERDKCNQELLDKLKDKQSQHEALLAKCEALERGEENKRAKEEEGGFGRENKYKSVQSCSEESQEKKPEKKPENTLLEIFRLISAFEEEIVWDPRSDSALQKWTSRFSASPTKSFVHDCEKIQEATIVLSIYAFDPFGNWAKPSTFCLKIEDKETPIPALWTNRTLVKDGNTEITWEIPQHLNRRHELLLSVSLSTRGGIEIPLNGFLGSRALRLTFPVQGRELSRCKFRDFLPLAVAIAEGEERLFCLVRSPRMRFSVEVLSLESLKRSKELSKGAKTGTSTACKTGKPLPPLVTFPPELVPHAMVWEKETRELYVSAVKKEQQEVWIWVFSSKGEEKRRFPTHLDPSSCLPHELKIEVGLCSSFRFPDFPTVLTLDVGKKESKSTNVVRHLFDTKTGKPRDLSFEGFSFPQVVLPGSKTFGLQTFSMSSNQVFAYGASDDEICVYLNQLGLRKLHSWKIKNVKTLFEEEGRLFALVCGGEKDGNELIVYE